MKAIVAETNLAGWENYFKALGEPVRLRLFVLLAGQPVCVCDLSVALNLPQPTVSRHLSVLKKAGLITSFRRGTWNYYQLNRENPQPGEIVNMVLAMSNPEEFERDQASLEEKASCLLAPGGEPDPNCCSPS